MVPLYWRNVLPDQDPKVITMVTVPSLLGMQEGVPDGVSRKCPEGHLRHLAATNPLRLSCCLSLARITAKPV